MHDKFQQYSVIPYFFNEDVDDARKEIPRGVEQEVLFYQFCLLGDFFKPWALLIMFGLLGNICYFFLGFWKANPSSGLVSSSNTNRLLFVAFM